MKTPFLATMLLALTAGSVFAIEDGSLSGKAMKDHPGHIGSGLTVNPTARPTSGALSDAPSRNVGGRAAIHGRSVQHNDVQDGSFASAVRRNSI